MSDYVIELDRWSISKEGTNALETSKGINSALLWADLEGYSRISFPRGTYLIDETTPVLPRSYSTIDLAGSTLKINPNDLEGYSVVNFDTVRHARLTNGIILGDRDQHTYKVDGIGSDTHEGGHGIIVGGASRFLDIDNLEISHCTGDAVMSYGTFPSLAAYLRKATCEKGSWSLVDGTEVTDLNRIRFTTKIMMSDPAIARSMTWGVYGGGYGGLGSDITSQFYDVVYYNLDGSFHSSVDRVQFFDDLLVPTGASYAKVSLYQSLIPEDANNSLWVRVFAHPESIFFDKLDLHHCRRQGMSLSGKHIHVTNSEIHHIGGSNTSTPIGTDPQGGIDIEDGYDLNQHFYIENNNFHDNWGYDLVITNGKHMNITGNRFNKVGKYVSVAINAPVDQSFFTKNTIHQGRVVISGEVTTSENRFYGCNVTLGDAGLYGRKMEVKDCSFHNCVVTLDQGVAYTLRLDGCEFLNDSQKAIFNMINTLTLKNEPQTLINCSFEGKDKSYLIYNLNKPKSGWIFDNITFNKIENGIGFPCGTLRDCLFNNIPTIAFSANSDNSGEVDMINCTIKSPDQNNTLLAIGSMKRFRMEGCQIEKKDSLMLDVGNVSESVIVKDNVFRYVNPVFANRGLLNIQESFNGLYLIVEDNIAQSTMSKPFILNNTKSKVILRDNDLFGLSLKATTETLINNTVDGVLVV